MLPLLGCIKLSRASGSCSPSKRSRILAAKQPTNPKTDLHKNHVRCKNSVKNRGLLCKARSTSLLPHLDDDRRDVIGLRPALAKVADCVINRINQGARALVKICSDDLQQPLATKRFFVG